MFWNLTLNTQSFADGFRLIQRGQFFEGWHKYVFVGKSQREMEFVDWYYCKLLLVEWKRRLSLRTPNYWHTSYVLKRCLKSKVHGQIFWIMPFWSEMKNEVILLIIGVYLCSYSTFFANAIAFSTSFLCVA